MTLSFIDNLYYIMDGAVLPDSVSSRWASCISQEAERVYQGISWVPHFISFCKVFSLTIHYCVCCLMRQYALKYGYNIQPVYVFGEEFTFWYVHNTSKINLILFYGGVSCSTLTSVFWRLFSPRVYTGYSIHVMILVADAVLPCYCTLWYFSTHSAFM